MIIGFVGTPGSGKTYEAVKKIVDNLLTGRVIYTNIEGIEDGECQEMIKSVCNLDDYQLKKQLICVSNSEALTCHETAKHGSLIVIDEVHKLFSSREWNTDKNKKFAEWASTHRHFGFDVVLITQDINKVDSHVRSLLEWCYLFRKVNFFGGAVQKKYICYSYAGDDHTGSPMAKNVRTYDSKIFACYKSFVGRDVKELGFMKHVNVFKHPVFFAIPIMLCLTLYMVFFRSSLATGDILGAKKMSKRYEQKPAFKPVSSVRSAVPLPSPVAVAIAAPARVSVAASFPKPFTQKLSLPMPPPFVKDKEKPQPKFVSPPLDKPFKFTLAGLGQVGEIFVGWLSNGKRIDLTDCTDVDYDTKTAICIPSELGFSKTDPLQVALK